MWEVTEKCVHWIFQDLSIYLNVEVSSYLNIELSEYRGFRANFDKMQAKYGTEQYIQFEIIQKCKKNKKMIIYATIILQVLRWQSIIYRREGNGSFWYAVAVGETITTNWKPQKSPIV